jgi:hypothetical protein
VIDRSTLTAVTATSVEARAVRREVRGVQVLETGVALARFPARLLSDTVVSCGLAGGLRRDVPAGTVLIPRSVRRPNGEVLECDPDLVQALAVGARSLGYEPLLDPMMTSATIVRGADRQSWANRGYASVDMETGLLYAPRVAAVRVVLDTPLRELSADWLRPVTAILQPRNWSEAFWLARAAPEYALVAASVLNAALRCSQTPGGEC